MFTLSVMIYVTKVILGIEFGVGVDIVYDYYDSSDYDIVIIVVLSRRFMCNY